MKSRAKWCGVVSLLVLFSVGAPAWAEEGLVRSSSGVDAYSYDFEDDPLDASPQEARGVLIRARPGGVRSILIRPRTHFVREIFASAENL